MARILIGSATTDANGVATLSYTGSGVGKMQIVAEIVVESGTYTSSTFQLGDWLCYDGGVTGDKSTAWTFGEKISSSVTDEGTILTVQKSTVATGMATSTKPLTGNFEVIVYCESGNGSGNERVRFGLTDGSSRVFIQRGGNYWLKLVRQGGVTTGFYSSDGETWTAQTVSGTEPSGQTLYITIGLYNTSDDNNYTVLYRDLKAYSIQSIGE